MYMFKCYLIDSYSDLHIYIGFHCIVFNIISGRVLRWKPQLHCEEFLNKHLLAAWFLISHSTFIPLCEPFANRIVERSKVDAGIWEWPNSLTTHLGSLFKSFIKSNGCTSTCGPEITFLSREMDGTKPLIRYASPTSLLSLHKGSATKCYHHHDFKTQTATSFNSIREHFSVCFHGYWPLGGSA